MASSNRRNNISVDIENFKKNSNFKLSRKRKVGAVVVGALVVGMVAGSAIGNKLASSNQVDETITSDNSTNNVKAIEVDLQDINNMNIIINDNECNGTFFDGVCDNLEKSGVNFSVTSKCQDIDVDNSVVITLDQQYISGPGMVVMVPYDNSRLGDNDYLALAMETGFYEKGFFTDGIVAGKVGYREMPSGEVQTRVPTSTEDAIGKDKNTAFVTLAFGTQNANSQLVAEGIENSLARYVESKKEQGLENDLIYRVEGGDTYEELRKKFDDNSIESINKYNNLDYNNERLFANDTMRNPSIENFEAFKSKTPVVVVSEKTKWY